MHETFERALREEPDDLVTWQAYGDWLVEQGDPRGDHVLTSLALEDLQAEATQQRLAQQGAAQQGGQALQAEIQRLILRLEELRRDNVWKWLDDLAPFLAKSPFQFRRGWLSSAQVWNDEELIRTLVRSRAAQFLEEVTFAHSAGWRSADRFVSLVRKAPWLGRLRSFTAGSAYERDGQEMLELVRQMKRLQTLRLFRLPIEGRSLFTLPTLSELVELKVTELRSAPLAVLAANPACRRLERLTVWSPTARALASVDVWAVLRSPHFQLRELDVGSLADGDGFCEQAAREGLPPHLERLALPNSRITDAGVLALLESGQLARLQGFDLNNHNAYEANQMSEATIDRLYAAHVKLSPFTRLLTT